MTIMRQETPEGQDPERWRNARAWLKRLPGWEYVLCKRFRRREL
jgi:hypothetical protein